MEDSLQTDAEHVFLTAHVPVYSATLSNFDEMWAGRIEEFLDNTNHKVRAIFTGHEHLFSCYNRSNVLIMVNGNGGGTMEPLFKGGFDELHGPLTFGPI